MKKRISISLIAFSAFVMLALTALPHHHHEDIAVGTITSDCDHSSPLESSSAAFCTIQSNFILNSVSYKIRCSIPSFRNANPVFSSLLLSLHGQIPFVQASLHYGRYVYCNEQTGTYRTCSLRAPPCV